MDGYKVLELASPQTGRKRRSNTTYNYYYKVIDDVAHIKIVHGEKEYLTQVDTTTLECLKKEVTRIYATPNSIGKVYLSVAPATDTSSKIPFGRFVLGSTEVKENHVVDHMNGNQLDNRLENLRIVDKKTNMRNRKYNSVNKTGFRGVYSNGKGGWQVVINLGDTYKTKEEASKVYREAYEKLFPGSLIQE